MGSIYNVGVPLAFSFAITESEEVYQRIYDTFLKKLSIDLSKNIFESDQGKALNTFFTKNSIKNLVCNRHLLVSLQKNIFSFQIGNIVKCRNQLDLDTCFCLYSDEFEKFLIDYKEQHGEKALDDMKKQLNIILEKVGLTFSKLLKIHDDETFIGSYPLSYYAAVSSGIYKFSGKIEEINFDDDDDNNDE